MNQVKIYKNAVWDEIKSPMFTISTPIYNRRAVIERPLNSVLNQTFRDFEYILVDDGSTEDCDDIIFDYMDKVSFPVMYIKKTNGGVHTARNMATLYARGILLCGLDSDDELKKNALEVLFAAYNNIPDEEKALYFSIEGLFENQNGECISKMFPDDINHWEAEEARKMKCKLGISTCRCSMAKIRKENLFLEPEGVFFVQEDLLWKQIEKNYRSYYINESIYIYHLEGNDHLSGIHNDKTIQNCKNALWESYTRLNRPELYIISCKELVINLLRYNTMYHILKKKEIDFIKRYSIERCKLLSAFFYIPGWIYALYYRKKRMKNER